MEKPKVKYDGDQMRKKGFGIALDLSSKLREETTNRDFKWRIMCSQITESKFSSNFEISTSDWEETKW